VKRRALYSAIAFGVLALDQLTKRWAVEALRGQPDVVVVDGLLRLVYAENPGIAFSFFNSGASATRWALVAVSSVAAAIVCVYMARLETSAVRLHVTLALLLGGIVGNLVDRIAYGRVVDFIDVYWNTYHWPTFNVADSAISVGACLLALELLSGGAAERQPEGTPAEGTENRF
jgi:signal peptidase II